MPFLTILRTVEELLYEVVTWLIFYPLTLWRCIWHPEALMRYTTEELQEAPEERFTESVSPPLFLMLSLLVAHGIELWLGVRIEEAETRSRMARIITGSEENLLLFRSFAFAIFPLVMAAGVVRRKGLKLDRPTLRGPFFRQCYFAGPFCLMMSTASALMRHAADSAQVGGLILAGIGFLWYVQVESRWFHRELQLSWPRAIGLAVRLFLIAAFASSLVGFVVLNG